MPAPPHSQKRPRGLAAIQQARADRAARRTRVSPGLGYVAAAVVIATAVAYKCVGDRKINVGKEALLQKHKDAASVLGAQWFPVRDLIEQRTVEDAKSWAGDFVDPSIGSWDFRSMPGIYLRLRVTDAHDAASIRLAAAESPRDGFTGCLLHPPRDIPVEADGGAFPDLPWTMGEAYAAARVASDEWRTDVEQASTGMRLDVLSQEYDDWLKNGLPVAGRLVKQAKYFLLVLDEDVPQAATFADGGAITERALQLVAHPARVYVLDLASKAERLRLRRTGSASVMGPGEPDPEKREAAQRQVNNCALARQVERAMEEPAPSAP